MKYFTLTATLLGATAFAPSVHAQDLAKIIDDIEITSTLDTVSEYVFRGVSLGENSVQPGTEISLGGFYVGSWYSAGFGSESDAQADELDLYVGYSLPLGDDISVDVGGTYYHYPQSGSLFETGDDGAAGTYEVFGSAGLNNVPLSPTGSVYYDFTLDNLTLEGSVGHSFDLPRDLWTADVGVTGGHVDQGGGGSYQWATGTIALNKQIIEAVSFSLHGNLTLNSDADTLSFESVETPTGFVPATDSSTLFWVGTGLTVGF